MQGFEEPEEVRPNADKERDPRPLAVTYEFLVVDGEEGKLVAARQAHAIRELLQWMADKASQGRDADPVVDGSDR